MASPLIVVTGTYRQPELKAYFPRNTPHPRLPGKSLSDLMKSFPAAYWRTDHWSIKGIGRFDAEGVFERAGFEIDFESETYDTDLEGIDDLDELVPPMIHLTEDRRNVLIRHRLLGFQDTKELLGTGAMWDRGKQRFYMPVGDLIKRGEPREGLDIPDDALEAAWEQHDRIHTGDHLVAQASKAALAKDVVDLSEDEIKTLVSEVGDIPEWFGLPLYPYQRVGAIAVASGHNLLADGMRVGKAVAASSRVLTPMGWTTMSRISVGDLVVGSDGRASEVTGVFPQGKRASYRITLSDGHSVITDGEHLWTVTDESGVTQTITSSEIATRLSGGSTFDLPQLSPVVYSPARYAEREVSPASAAAWGEALAHGDFDSAESFLHAPVELREGVLAGALRKAVRTDDGDIQWEPGSPRAAGVLVDIIRSLGRVASMKHGDVGGPTVVTLHPEGTSRRIVKVRAEGREREMICISVSAGDHLFVIDGYVLTHNTRTTLAVAAMRDSKRTLIVCPPVVLTNWHRNVDECLLATLGGKNPDGTVVEYRPGRKEPELPDSGVVIISDSLMTSRKHLQDAIVDWAPDVMVYDEAIDLEEPILTTAGWKTVGSLREGDHVFAPSGEPVLVKRLTPIKDDAECLRVTLSDGSSVVVDAGHLWLAEPRVNGGSAYLKPRAVTTRQLLDSMAQGRTWRLPEVSPVEGVEKELPLPPYVLGAWLGDGSADQPHITVSKDRTDALVAELGRHWGDVRVIQTSPHKANRVSLADSGGVGGKPSLFRTAAEEIGVWGNKHIPDDYLLASVDHRLELLRGLMDTDGYVSRVRGELRNVFTFSNTNKRIIDGFVYLVRSLGMIPGVHENKNYGRGEESVCWRVSFTAAPGISLFSMRNQDSTFVSVTRAMKRRIVSIDPVESRQVRCIEVDSEDHLFLVGKSLIPTHNCHRAKNFESARTQAALRVAAASAFPIPATGTPLFQTPQELAALLEMTGHLTPVFGGLDEFHETYCVQNKWGGFTPRMKSLPDLRRMLDTYVWVRRTKDQVLKDLPKVSRGAIDLDIDLKEFNAAHREVVEKINDWLDEFEDEFGRLPSHEHVNSRGRSVDEIEDHAREKGLTYISKLRRAAGITKVPAAVDYIKDHISSTTEIDSRGRKTFTRPLLVWTHHTEVSIAMSEVVPNEVDDAAIIMGGISQNKRQRLIDEFQEGRIPVLVCQISAAGVGIDLTRSSDALFVETDWVPALVQQAEERIQGVNQKRPVMLSTMVAKGTLDDRIQRIQEDKAKVLDPVLGGKNDVSVVSVSDDEANSAAILMDMVDTEIKKRKKR